MGKAISPHARSIMEILIAGLDQVGASRKFDNGGAGIMAVSVERTGASTFSVAHYYEQNGDLLADPEMEFHRDQLGDFYPMHFQQDNVGLYQECMRLDGTGRVTHLNQRTQTEQASFASLWMRNINEQQRL